MKRLGSVSLRVAVLLIVAATATSGQEAAPPNPSLLKATFSRLPIYFIENRGVYPDEVAYYVQGADKTLFFTRKGITFRLKGTDRAWVAKLAFVGANPDVIPRGEDRQPAVFSYFRGPEKDWKTGLPTVARVVYEEIWPGVDLVYRGTVNRLKYEFVVKPGADPGRIGLRYRGVTSVTRTPGGALRVVTPAGSFEDARPVAWQDIGGRRVAVEAAWSPVADAGYAFCLGDYDATKPLVLDPALLVYCGYIGGHEPELGDGIALDSWGNAYVTGETFSDQTSFPVQVGPDLTHNGGHDAFVAKVSPDGTGLVYCGYIGGASIDEGNGIAVDGAGNAYVSGSTLTNEATFPVKGGPDLTHNGQFDAFVAKVNPQGTGLVYCGYVGGSSMDCGLGIAVDASGSAYVTGYCWSDEKTFPVQVGPDLTYNGSAKPPAPWGDAFVAKVEPSGTRLIYCGYIGGSGGDLAWRVTVDASGQALVAGTTESSETTFPVKGGPDLTHNGGYDAFVARVNAQGTGLVHCGYIGGSSADEARDIVLDGQGNIYVAGSTGSDQNTFPVRVGPDLTYNAGGSDAFVAKLNAQATGIVYCGYIGGTSADWGRGIAVDAEGNAYVAGETLSDEKSFPVRVGPDLTYNGPAIPPGPGIQGDGFIAKVKRDATSLAYCGYIGGALPDACFDITVSTSGTAYVTGGTISDETTFPVKVGPDLTYNDMGMPLGMDAFVAMIGTVFLTGSGDPRPGGTVSLSLSAYESAGLAYQLGTSFGTGPIPIDIRRLDLSADNLLVLTTSGAWPSVFSGYRGMMDAKGESRAAIHIPSAPGLIGVRLHTAFVTLDPQAPSGIKAISNTLSFSITK